MIKNKWTTFSKRQGMIFKKKKTKIIQDYIKLLDEVDKLKSKLFESNTQRDSFKFAFEEQKVDLESLKKNQANEKLKFLEEKVVLLEKVISLTEEKDRAKVLNSYGHSTNGVITKSSSSPIATSTGNSTTFTI